MSRLPAAPVPQGWTWTARLDPSGGDTAYAVRAFGLMAAAWSLMNFIASPVLGALSDRFGRRPVILISTFGRALDLLVMALAPTVAWLFVGRAICPA